MSNDDFNLSLTADASTGTITKGVHFAKCTSAKKERNRANDGDNLVFEFEIQSEGQEGRKIRMWQTLKNESMYTRTFRAFGILPGPNGKFTINSRSFVGKTVRLLIKHEDYRGEMQPSIDRIMDANGPAEHEKEPSAAPQTQSAPPARPSAAKATALGAKKTAAQTAASNAQEDDEEPIRSQGPVDGDAVPEENPNDPESPDNDLPF